MTQEQIENLMALAIQHHQAGRLGPAEDLYRQVLALRANHFDALHLLGLIAHQVGKPDIAIAMIQTAIRLDPTKALLYKNLATVLKVSGRFAEAAAVARSAIKLEPADADAFGILGNALGELGRLEEALAAHRHAVELCPNDAKTVSRLGACLTDLGRFDEAVATHQRAVELEPDLAGAHWNLSFALLSKGDFAGWKEYEWRWKFDAFTSPRRNFRQPLWTGDPLAGRRLLLHAEQGFGDSIHFIRYLPRVADRIGDGTLLLECQRSLAALFRQCREVQSIIPAGDPLPDFDVHCPLLSLPLMLGDRLETIPCTVPYLQADAKDYQAWSDLFNGRGNRLRVGLCWAGSSTHRYDHNRSTKLSNLPRCPRSSDVDFFSLQLGGDAQVAEGHFPNLIDNSRLLTDFAQTAACIAHLDLVISVDTAVAHLAGAMGKPTWILLPFAADWRWLRERLDSPWYPSARLFRQRAFGQWDEQICQVREQLQRAAANGSIEPEPSAFPARP